MITHSIIQKSQLEGGHRLDAEYFQPQYLEIVNKLLEIKNSLLGNIVQKITQGPNPQFIEWGKCCLNGRNVKNFRVDPEESNYVSEQEFEKYRNFKVKNNDILITLKGLGSIGKTGYVFKELGCVFSRDVGLIRLNNELLSKFVYAFLLSKYGSGQVERAITGGTGQLTLATSALKQIIIPEFQPKIIKEIAELISESEENYESSKNIYQQAETLLLEKLGLRDFQVEDDLSFIMNLSDVKSIHRVDADYFQPKYGELESKIKNYGAKKLTYIIDNVAARFNPEAEENYRYVELSNINSSIGIIDGFTEVLGREAPSRAKRILKNGDIIVSSVEGSLEKVALADKEQEAYLASTGFFQFRSKEILPEVLLVLAKSIVLQWQLKKHCAGTILTAVPNEALQKMFVPTISNSTQQKIADLVRKSHEARKKSRELLEEAKRKVEEMIERGDDN